jgi:hypothetical protein
MVKIHAAIEQIHLGATVVFSLSWPQQTRLQRGERRNEAGIIPGGIFL